MALVANLQEARILAWSIQSHIMGPSSLFDIYKLTNASQ